MKYTKVIFSLSAIAILNACVSKDPKIEEVSVKEGGFYHNDMYFGKNFSKVYKEGIVDGCTTASGNYKKSHIDFKNNLDYENGWFLGRNMCNTTVLENTGKVTGIFKER